MTETLYSQAPPAAARLERPRDAALKGVSVALARHTATDVVLWRVLFVVLSFFGGLGIVLYLAGMVAIPVEGEERSVGDRLLHGPDRHLHRNHLVLVVILVIATVSLINDTDGVLTVAVLGGLVFLWWRNRTGPTPIGYGASPVPGASPTSADPVNLAVGPAYPATPPRPRSPLVGVTLSAATLIAGVLVLVGVSGGASVPAELVLAAALATVGVGLVAGSFFGRAPGLVAVALVLGLGLAGTAGARPAIDAGIGDRTWVPAGSGSYRLGVGEATLDLRDLPVRETDPVAIDARVDVGHLLVIVPDGLRVAMTAKAQLGDVLVLGADTNGRHVDRTFTLGSQGRPQVRLDLSVRTGQVEVRRG